MARNQFSGDTKMKHNTTLGCKVTFFAIACFALICAYAVCVFADTTETVKYNYYTDNQLKTETYGNLQIGYIYDASGNRTAKNTSSLIPKIAVSSGSLDFGEVVIGTTAIAQSSTITNVGGAALSVGTITINGSNSSEFIIQTDTCAGSTLQPADTCRIDVTFQPAAPVATKSATLNISSNAANNPSLSVGLSGSAILQHYTLTVTKAGSGSGTINVDAGSLIWNGNVGTANYEINTPVNISAVAVSGSSFVVWNGDCHGNGNTCSLTMTSEKSVSAAFNSKTDFSATPTTGFAPLIVSFTDASTHSPTSWSWNFGDGGASTEQGPVHVYTSSGNYTVSLTATGIGGAVTMTKTNYISVSSCSHNKVKIGGTPYYYPTIQTAYNVTTNKESVQMQALPFSENLNLQHNTNIKLQGGFGCDYLLNPGWTTINGSLTISGGTVTIENVVIK